MRIAAIENSKSRQEKPGQVLATPSVAGSPAPRFLSIPIPKGASGVCPVPPRPVWRDRTDASPEGSAQVVSGEKDKLHKADRNCREYSDLPLAA
jgi:hypothetical protein